MLPVLAVAQSPTGYMKVDAIVGGAIGAVYGGWSEITGLDWSINTSYTSSLGGGTSSSLPRFQMSVTMPLDRASGPIAFKQARGQRTDEVKIELVDVNKNTSGTYAYQKFTLTDVFFVENINKWSATSTDALTPNVTVTMVFKTIKVEHFIINKVGTRVKTGEWTYDLGTGGA